MWLHYFFNSVTHYVKRFLCQNKIHTSRHFVFDLEMIHCVTVTICITNHPKCNGLKGHCISAQYCWLAKFFFWPDPAWVMGWAVSCISGQSVCVWCPSDLGFLHSVQLAGRLSVSQGIQVLFPLVCKLVWTYSHGGLRIQYKKRVTSLYNCFICLCLYHIC